MFYGLIDQPFPFALLVVAGLVSVPGVLIAVHRGEGPDIGPARALTWLGRFNLAGLWLVLLPLAILNLLIGEPMVAVFGSETQSVSLVDHIAAANLGAVAVLGLVLSLRESRPALLAIFGIAGSVLFFFTAFEETGLDEAVWFAFPTDHLASSIVAPGYAAGGWMMIAGAWAFLSRGSGMARRAAGGEQGAVYAAALWLTAGFLLQHRVFEEIAELAFSTAVLQALAVLALDRRSTGAAAPCSAHARSDRPACSWASTGPRDKRGVVRTI